MQGGSEAEEIRFFRALINREVFFRRWTSALQRREAALSLIIPAVHPVFLLNKLLLRFSLWKSHIVFSTFSLSSWRFGRIRTREIFRERVRGGDGGGGKGRERNAGVGGLCPAHTGERAHTSPRTKSYVGPYVFWCLPCVVRADRRPRPAHCYALLSSGLGMGVM